MKFPASVSDFDRVGELPGPLHLAIGVFDGVHLGHKVVIESAVFAARRTAGVSGVLTFDPHPSRLFRPDAPTRLIMDIEAKTAQLQDMGVDVVIRKRFDQAFASIPAEDFLPHLKRVLPRLVAVYIGENFRFGRKRGGRRRYPQPLRFGTRGARHQRRPHQTERPADQQHPDTRRSGGGVHRAGERIVGL